MSSPTSLPPTAKLRRRTSPGLLGGLLALAGGIFLAVEGAKWLLGYSATGGRTARTRRRYRIPELTKRLYFAPGDRVRYGQEFLRTAGAGDWQHRRGEVVSVRKLAQYQGDPNPRQLVMVKWDGDDEPTRVLNESLGLVSRG